jgi:hypothetical protein
VPAPQAASSTPGAESRRGEPGSGPATWGTGRSGGSNAGVTFTYVSGTWYEDHFVHGRRVIG